MNKTLCGVVVSSLLCFAGAGYANGSMPAQPVVATPAHPGGWVIGVDAGYGELSTVDDNLFSSVLYPEEEDYHTLSQSRDIGDFVWGGHIGREFSVTDNILLGVELGYKDLGRSKYDSRSFYDYDYYGAHYGWNVEVDQQAVDLLLTGKYYIWEGLNILGKVGFAYVRSETESNYSYSYYDNHNPDYNDSYGLNYSKTVWRLKPEVAVGVGYSFTPNLDVHLIYDYIHGESGGDSHYGQAGAGNLGDGGSFNPRSDDATVYASNAVFLGISYSFNP